MLSMILPAIVKFKKVSLTLDDSSDSVFAELIYAFSRAPTMSSQCVDVWQWINKFETNVRSLNLSFNEALSSICIETSLCGLAPSLTLGLTFPRSEIINIDWIKLFQILHQRDSDALMSVLYSVSKLKKIKMKVDCLSTLWTVWSLQITQNCPSLTELTINADFLLEEGIKILQRSYTRPACIMTFQGLIRNKQHQKCSNWQNKEQSCNQEVKIRLNCQGFSMETLRKPLWN